MVNNLTSFKNVTIIAVQCIQHYAIFEDEERERKKIASFVQQLSHGVEIQQRTVAGKMRGRKEISAVQVQQLPSPKSQFNSKKTNKKALTNIDFCSLSLVVPRRIKENQILQVGLFYINKSNNYSQRNSNKITIMVFIFNFQKNKNKKQLILYYYCLGSISTVFFFIYIFPSFLTPSLIIILFKTINCQKSILLGIADFTLIFFIQGKKPTLGKKIETLQYFIIESSVSVGIKLQLLLVGKLHFPF